MYFYRSFDVDPVVNGYVHMLHISQISLRKFSTKYFQALSANQQVQEIKIVYNFQHVYSFVILLDFN